MIGTKVNASCRGLLDAWVIDEGPLVAGGIVSCVGRMLRADSYVGHVCRGQIHMWLMYAGVIDLCVGH